MKKTHSHRSIVSSSQFSLFSETDDSANPRPLYLFCSGEANNELFIFLSNSPTQSWVKKNKVWNELEIKNLLKVRDGGSKIYSFKRNHYDIDTLHIPYPFKNNASYTSLKEGRTVPLTMIPLSEEELDANDITNLEAFDLTGIPETRKQVQQQLEETEKEQAVETEIQKIDVIIGSLKRAVVTIQKLETHQKGSIQLLTEQIEHYDALKKDLVETYRLLEQPTKAIAEVAKPTRYTMQM